jgi:hypothetical protein
MWCSICEWKKTTGYFVYEKGINYHFRIVNITAGWADIETSIKYNDKPVSWKPLAKDGADLPSYQQK